MPENIKFPSAWPTDKRSRIITHSIYGWVLYHPDRELMAFKDGSWINVQKDEKAA